MVLITQTSTIVTEKEQQHIFGDWLHRYKALVFKTVRAYAFTAMDRDDLFQEISIQIWNSIPTFRQESSPVTWIYRISLNTAIKWVRKEQKHQQVETLDHVQHILREKTVQVDQRLTWLYEEIHKLDEIDRSLTLLMLENFSYREMAQILGISESNVGVKINRIKKQLISKSKKI
jgi:RNA polymerase sigma-70 factor (ECF subfamily)